MLNDFKKLLSASALFPLFISLQSLLLSAYAIADEEEGVSTGTGWVIAPHFVVTNHHVVGKASTVTLVRTDNRQLTADVVMRDPINDVAILKPRKIKLLPAGLPMAPRSANVGANVFTIGYPLLGLMGREPKLTTGFINARTGIANDPRTYQISIPIQPGNSGGPVFNMNGEVIGIATSSLSAAAVFKWAGNLPQNVNYAVKTNYVRALLDATPIHGNQTIETLQPGEGNLETLVQRVKDSIMIVIAGETVEETPKQADSSNPPANANPKQKESYALYVHMKPHNYDVRDGNTKDGIDDTTKNYSTNVSKLVKKYIKKVAHGKLKLKHEKVGKNAKPFVYEAYHEDQRQSLCTRKGVDYLFSVKNDRHSMGLMDITYYIFDCNSKSDFYYSKDLTYNLSDSFMYESHLKKLLRSMLEDKPSDIGFLED